VSDNHTRPLSITIKYGKGYEETWAVFQGTAAEVRTGIEDYFGLSIQETEELTLNQLVVNVTKLAHGTQAAASKLGAVSIPKSQAVAPQRLAEPEQEAPTKDPWTEAEKAPPAKPAEPAKPARNPIYDEIDACTSIKPALTKVWATHQDAINADEDLLDYFKAHGAKLKAAG
jgi:hypothetical protein